MAPGAVIRELPVALCLEEPQLCPKAPPPPPPPPSLSPSRNRWTQVREMMRILLDVAPPLSTESRSSPHGRRRRYPAPVLLSLHPDFWLEALDPRHRYGFHLRAFHDVWKREMQQQQHDAQHYHAQDRSFFYWLDHGAGSELELPACTREALNAKRVEYLAPAERSLHQVAFHHPDKASLRFVATQELVQTDSGSKWIFVVDRDERLYIARKNKGSFHHSSFLAGRPIAMAGKIYVDKGRIRAIEPHSGHFKPSMANLEYLVQFLTDNGVDLESVHFVRPRKWRDPWHYPESETAEAFCEIGDSDDS